MPELSEIHAYYRQCQTVMQNGKQCRCPAQKGSDTCRNHAGQNQRLEKRRAAQAGVLQAAAERMTSRTGRKHRPEEVFRGWVGIRAALHEVGQATIEGRLDEDGAAELLAELERAALQIGHRHTGSAGIHEPQRRRRNTEESISRDKRKMSADRKTRNIAGKGSSSGSGCEG